MKVLAYLDKNTKITLTEIDHCFNILYYETNLHTFLKYLYAFSIKCSHPTVLITAVSRRRPPWYFSFPLKLQSHRSCPSLDKAVGVAIKEQKTPW